MLVLIPLSMSRHKPEFHHEYGATKAIQVNIEISDAASEAYPMF